MPEFLDNPKALTMKFLSEMPEDDPRKIDAKSDLLKLRDEIKAMMREWHADIQAKLSWFDGSSDAYARLFALLSVKLGKPIDWFIDHISYQNLIAILNEIPSPWLTVKRSHLMFAKTKLNELFKDQPDKIRRCADKAFCEICREMKGAWIKDIWQKNYP